jgi:hypothetical protein
MTVLVDEADEEGALARSPGDAPEIDGLVHHPERRTPRTRRIRPRAHHRLRRARPLRRALSAGRQHRPVGGATPLHDGQAVVINLSRLRRIREIDPANNTITVEAGCTAGRGAGRRGGRRPPVPALPGGRGQLRDRRQPVHQRRRRAGAALRQHARADAGPGSRAARRPHLARPARPAQGQHRLRPQAPLHRRRGHAGHHHRRRAEALSAPAPVRPPRPGSPCPIRPPRSNCSRACAAPAASASPASRSSPARRWNWC